MSANAKPAHPEEAEKEAPKAEPTPEEGERATTRRKAAIVIMSMGAEAAGQIFRHLNEEEVEELTTEITNIKSIDEDARLNALSEFITNLRARDMGQVGGMFAARSILNKALGAERAARILEQVEKPDSKGAYFDYLERVEASQIINFLMGEQPQTIAMILSHLKPQRAAELLTALPEPMMQEVAERIGTMDRISPEIIRRIDHLMKKALVQNSEQRAKSVGGAKTIAEILNFSGKDAEKKVFDGLQERNPPLVDNIKKLMVVFEDLAVLTDQGMQAVLREVDMSVMALALKGASEAMRALVFRNLSQRAMERLKEEIELMGPKPRSEVASAQEQVVGVARKLEEDGKINLGKGGGGGDELIG